MIRYIAGVNETDDVSTIDIQSTAVDYLHQGGMTDAEIEAFIKKRTK